MAANAVEAGPPFNGFDAGWGIQCKLVGDYDVQADYRLLEWPATNGITGASGLP